MELADLLDHIDASELATPPAPPIFQGGAIEPEWWREFFDVGSGEELWARLVDRVGARTVARAPVTRQAWEALLGREKIRRAQRFWSFDRHDDGTMRPEPERQELRRLDFQACKGDFWHWFHEYGWIENPHAEGVELRVSPFLAWPGQVAYLWWFLESLWLGRRRGESVPRIVNKCRSAGVSWACCHLVAHPFLFEDHFSAKIGGLTKREVDDGSTYSLLGKIRFLYERQPNFLLPCYDFRHEVEDDATSFVRFVCRNTTTGGVIRGESITRRFARSGREVVVLRDEAAHVDAATQAASRLGQTSVAIADWTVSTPNGRGNAFHHSFEAARDENRLTIPWSIDPRRDDAWYDRLLLDNGGDLTRDARDQEYGCNFRGVSGLRIWSPDPEIVPYDDATPEWREVAAEARATWPLVCGLDFGDGPSPVVCRFALLDWAGGLDSDTYGRLPRLWWDFEVWGYRIRPDDFATQILDARREYGGQWSLYGDPSGKNPLVRGLRSWEGDLNDRHVPVVCLPEDPFTRRYLIDEALDLVDTLMAQGLWRVHRERSPVSLQMEEAWEWDLPPGLRVEQVNRASIKWKKDGPSHWCEAGWMGAMAALHYHQPRDRKPTSLDQLPMSLGGEMARIFR